MIERETITVSIMSLKEISPVLGELQTFVSASFLNTTEGKLRDAALKGANSILKATVGGKPLGIISVAEGPIAKIDAWMSNKELKESWANAINSAVKQMFNNPVAGKIEWRITSSSKDMLEVAKTCGFRQEGELLGEGLNREPLIVMALARASAQAHEANTATAAELAGKNKTIKELESALEASRKELDSKNELTKNLRKEKANLQKRLDEAEAKLIGAEDDKDFKETEIISALKQGVNELKTANHELENKLCEQANLLKEKSKRIIEQAKMIQKLKSTAEPKTGLREDDEKPTDESRQENSIEPEIETVAPELPIEKLGTLLSELGLNLIPREILKATILKPGIGYKELAGEAKTSIVYTTTVAGRLAKEPALIVIRHGKSNNAKAASLFPAKGIMQKLQKMAEDRKALGLSAKQTSFPIPGSPHKLNGFDIRVLKLAIAEPTRGLKQEEIISKICEQQTGTTKYKTQPKVSTSVTKLAVSGLVSKEMVGRECLVKPKVEKIRALPQELQEKLGIQETVEEVETPVVKSEEIAAKIKERMGKTTKPAVKVIEHPTPFRILVAILKEHAKNNGGGIEIQELQRIAIEKGLSKDEAASSIKALKREQVLTAWGNSPFHQINKEELAKIN